MRWVQGERGEARGVAGSTRAQLADLRAAARAGRQCAVSEAAAASTTAPARRDDRGYAPLPGHHRVLPLGGRGPHGRHDARAAAEPLLARGARLACERAAEAGGIRIGCA